MDYSQITEEIESFIEYKKTEPCSLGAEILEKNIKAKTIFAKITEGKQNLYPGALILINEKIRAFVLEKKDSFLKLQTKQNIKDIENKITIDINPMNVILREIEKIKERIKADKLTEKEKRILSFLVRKSKPEHSPSSYESEKLNISQKLAVKKSLEAKDFHLIVGPPGTGKTFVIVEIINQLIKNNKRILITAGTNVAVDNIVKKLSSLSVLRIGPINEINPEIKSLSLQEKMKTHPLWDSMEKMEKDIEQLENKISKISDKRFSIQENLNELKNLKEYTNQIKKINYRMYKGIEEKKELGEETKDIIEELKEKRSQLYELKKQAAHDLIEESSIVACTVASCANPFLEKNFDCMIMDEAGQVSTFISLLAILKADKFILVGDNKQLQPIKEEELNKLNQSIFNKLFYLYPYSNIFLDTQYRMNQQIADVASILFYRGALKTFDDISKQTLDIELSEKQKQLIRPDSPITFIDTSQTGWLEDEVEESRLHKKEAELVSSLVLPLINAGLDPNEIGIITPYKKQVSEIKDILKNNICVHEKVGGGANIIEVETIHRFQGREKDVIILSLVRSLEDPSWKDVFWFDKEKAKINVAITRPRKKLIIVGNSETLSKSRILKQLIEKIGKENTVIL